MEKEEMLRRIATIKTKEVEEQLPRIHIASEFTLSQLMAWRDRNKSKVRNIRPIMKEGVISALSKKSYFYFLQSDDDVYLFNKIAEGENVAFIYNIKKFTVLPINNSITFYPKDEVIQDLLTVYATCMAYLNEIGVSDIKEGDTFTIDKVIQ